MIVLPDILSIRPSAAWLDPRISGGSIGRPWHLLPLAGLKIQHRRANASGPLRLRTSVARPVLLRQEERGRGIEAARWGESQA